MKDRTSSANMGEVLRVLKDIQNARVIEQYAIGGAIAAILHYEPISTIDLSTFRAAQFAIKMGQGKVEIHQ